MPYNQFNSADYPTPPPPSVYIATDLLNAAKSAAYVKKSKHKTVFSVFTAEFGDRRWEKGRVWVRQIGEGGGAGEREWAREGLG